MGNGIFGDGAADDDASSAIRNRGCDDYIMISTVATVKAVVEGPVKNRLTSHFDDISNTIEGRIDILFVCVHVANGSNGSNGRLVPISRIAVMRLPAQRLHGG